MRILLLAAAGLTILGLSLVRGNRRVKIALFSMATSCLATVDMVMVVFLRRYAYQPRLVASPLQDNYLGELLADLLFVPALMAAVVGSLPSRFRLLSVPLLSTLFALLEIWLIQTGEFLSLNWSTWYTLGLFAFFSLLATYGANRMERHGYTVVHRFLLVATAAHTLWTLWIILTGAIGRHWLIPLALTQDPETNHALGSLLLHGLPFLTIAQVAVRVKWVGSPVGLALVGVALTLWFYGWSALGLWKVGLPGSQLIQAAALTLLLLPLKAMDRWFFRLRPSSPGE